LPEWASYERDIVNQGYRLAPRWLQPPTRGFSYRVGAGRDVSESIAAKVRDVAEHESH
jgi:hypothetical protein